MNKKYILNIKGSSSEVRDTEYEEEGLSVIMSEQLTLQLGKWDNFAHGGVRWLALWTYNAIAKIISLYVLTTPLFCFS